MRERKETMANLKPGDKVTEEYVKEAAREVTECMKRLNKARNEMKQEEHNLRILNQTFANYTAAVKYGNGILR